MFNELLKRLGSRKSERRSADRVRRRYPIAWVKDGTLVPGLGLEISEKGILFATKEAPPAGNVEVALDLNGRRVRARLRIVRKGTMTRDGVEWAVIACVFEGIAADDWDAIVRFCKNVDDPGNKAAQELSALAGSDDDAYRLLPLRVQQRVVTVLVKAGRIAPGSDAKNPLLRMSYDGSTRTGEHRLAVHSRRLVDGELLQFDSVRPQPPPDRRRAAAVRLDRHRRRRRKRHARPVTGQRLNVRPLEHPHAPIRLKAGGAGLHAIPLRQLVLHSPDIG